MAQDSPLSRWAGQQVLKNLRFKLSLDDPRSSEDQWITIRGDRTQLDALQEAVENYVQNVLEQTSAHFNASFLTASGYPNATSQAVADPDSFYSLPRNLAGDNAFAEPRSENGISLRSDSERRLLLHAPVSLTDAARTHGIYLQPGGLLSHTLFLGSLATDETGPSIRLSALQLFDLSVALDEYTTDVVALPSLNRSGWLKSPPSWARVAAVAVLTIGLTTSIAKLLDGSFTNPQVATSTGSQGASSADQQFNQQAAPSPTASPGLQPIPPLASTQQLPPPPPPGSTTVPANPGLPTITVPQNAPPINSGVARAPVAESGSAVTRPNTPPRIVAKAGQGSAAANAPAELRLNPEISRSESNSRIATSSAEASRSAAADSGNSTAFDTIPQVAEARQYFQQRWQPPDGLSKDLEYSLVLAPNGTIERITPLGLASGDYIDRTGMPLLGEPFVSPVANGRTPKIRIVLTADGRVQAFLESP
jgi:hypothetical protein